MGLCNKCGVDEVLIVIYLPIYSGQNFVCNLEHYIGVSMSYTFKKNDMLM